MTQKEMWRVETLFGEILQDGFPNSESACNWARSQSIPVNWRLGTYDTVDELTLFNDITPTLDEPPIPSAFDTQVGGDHYKDMKSSPLRFIADNNMSFILGNVIKYTCRADRKGGDEDIRKAIHYLVCHREWKYGKKTKVEYEA